eukprot:TRINITY_DN72497_c0_g1_i1.p1 TRINITY_DN72497_c0_g1~~TRINITY_DN72497_c0_g1_i1.p1  ORF type:complete len:589 (-),score=116.17 TRINITY_DN72497_c0_g1_i1:134-1900(-)
MDEPQRPPRQPGQLDDSQEEHPGHGGAKPSPGGSRFKEGASKMTSKMIGHTKSDSEDDGLGQEARGSSSAASPSVASGSRATGSLPRPQGSGIPEQREARKPAGSADENEDEDSQDPALGPARQQQGSAPASSGFASRGRAFTATLRQGTQNLTDMVRRIKSDKVSSFNEDDKGQEPSVRAVPSRTKSFSNLAAAVRVRSSQFLQARAKAGTLSNRRAISSEPEEAPPQALSPKAAEGSEAAASDHGVGGEDRQAEEVPAGEDFELRKAGIEPNDDDEREPRRNPVRRLSAALVAVAGFAGRASARLSTLPQDSSDCMRAVGRWWSGTLDSLQDSLDQYADSRERRRAVQELRNMAVRNRLLEMPSSWDRDRMEKLERRQARLYYSHDEMMEAFEQLQRTSQDWLFVQVIKGHTPLKRALPWLVLEALLAAVLLLGWHSILSTIVFSSTSSVRSVASTGAIVDPGNGGAVGAAGLTALQPLWQFPSLSLQELRQVEDVVFSHGYALHVLHVAVMFKAQSGSVVLRAADGSAVRVEPDGNAYWRRNRAAAEVFLDEMQGLRKLVNDKSAESVTWLTAGSLPSEVLYSGT